ncbi:hypothetical protein JRQ81_018356 [Phrynocephalus forsythii]|uniref:Kinesin motor domain-containing protein n=1 Tax=Phrynocephalus forsythii TaxID=171643 RepID=A0A9Q1AZ85_9SAUR|nr:hypothetical protein JRQ81_018356 [Phrynocephalus forsythii]
MKCATRYRKEKMTIISFLHMHTYVHARKESLSKGHGLKEATYINKSLSFLEQVVIALSDRNRDHVPFRQSKLTYTLKDSLGGNCNTVLVANICSEAEHIIETLSTLRFATRMKWVTTQPIINEKIDNERMVKNLEKEVLYLKDELAMHNCLLNRPLVSYEPLNEIQIAEINSQVRRYLEGAIDELDIMSIRQIHEVFNQFKMILRQGWWMPRATWSENWMGRALASAWRLSRPSQAGGGRKQRRAKSPSAPRCGRKASPALSLGRTWSRSPPPAAWWGPPPENWTPRTPGNRTWPASRPTAQSRHRERTWPPGPAPRRPRPLPLRTSRTSAGVRSTGSSRRTKPS